MHLLSCGFLWEGIVGSRSRTPIWGVWGVTPEFVPVSYISRASNLTVNATYIDWKTR